MCRLGTGLRGAILDLRKAGVLRGYRTDRLGASGKGEVALRGSLRSVDYWRVGRSSGYRRRSGATLRFAENPFLGFRVA